MLQATWFKESRLPENEDALKTSHDGVGSFPASSSVFTNGISFDLYGTPMRFGMRYLMLRDEISHEIGRDFMRSDEILCSCHKIAGGRRHNIRFSTHCTASATRRALGNPEEIDG